MRLIGVIMGAKTAKERNAKMVSLLDYGFGHYQVYLGHKKGFVVKNINDLGYQPSNFKIILDNDVKIITSKQFQADKISYQYAINDNKKAILKGEDIGECLTYIDGILVEKTPLKLSENVRESSYFDKIKGVLKSMFS